MRSQGLGTEAVQDLIDAGGGSTDHLAGHTLIGASSTWTRTSTGALSLTAPSNGSAQSLKAAMWPVSGSSWSHSFEIGKQVDGSGSGTGLLVRDSVSGRCIALAIASTSTAYIYRLTLTTFAGAGVTVASPASAITVWLTVDYDGTTLSWYGGFGLGDKAILLGTEAVATYIAAVPDQVGVYQDPYNGSVSCAVRARLVA